MTIDELDLEQYYTYEDYMSWTFEERVELFRGKVYKIGPSPNVKHQTISLRLIVDIANFCLGDTCSVFNAPFDVRLPVSLKEGNTDTVVQPDIVVICDPTKLDEQGCNGAPDLVIEILSPGNSRKEMKEKFELYEASLVKEYWIVDPGNESVLVYTMNDQNKYEGSKPYVSEEIMRSSVIDGLEIEVTDVFKK